MRISGEMCIEGVGALRRSTLVQNSCALGATTSVNLCAKPLTRFWRESGQGSDTASDCGSGIAFDKRVHRCIA